MMYPYEKRSALARQWQSGENSEMIRKIGSPLIQRANSLKRGQRRMLLSLIKALEDKNFQPVNRREIAAAINHPRMHPHDLKLLSDLIEAGFVKGKVFALPTYELLSRLMPRGAEYRYAMNIDTAWLLAFAEYRALQAKQRRQGVTGMND